MKLLCGWHTANNWWCTKILILFFKCHIYFVKCHLPNVSSHLSHINCHLSNINCHPPHITCQKMTSVTFQLFSCHISCHLANVTSQMSSTACQLSWCLTVVLFHKPLWACTTTTKDQWNQVFPKNFKYQYFFLIQTSLNTLYYFYVNNAQSIESHFSKY